ncbi:C39 family peptidase [Siminovitchia sp. 179-K 8D1 HS]|uniref:C39 family peptidase n=1 Tax=Siminovitchia sp. 179-K 8D1 HS TaxID=3142385 RepID=UPI0039A15C91
MDGTALYYMMIPLLLLVLLFLYYKRDSLGYTIAVLVSGATFIFVLFNTVYSPKNNHAVAFQGAARNGDLEIIPIKDQVLLDAPVIKQLPELPRGCEVTALAMLLESAGVHADKMKLAKEVKKDPTPRIVKNGKVHFGNPHEGFVGNMYTFSEPGLGVYHEPIMELGEKYLPGQMVNLTGESFEELKIPLSSGRPVWVIINAEYRELDDSYFETWETTSGPIKVTMKEHSVLITGYDGQYVYFNDPLTGKKNKKAPIQDFEKSWVQMGSQALTYSGD